MLIIQPHLKEEDIHNLKKDARRRTFVRGEVIPSAHGLVFQSDDPLSGSDASQLLEQDLKSYFSKKVSALQNARVIPHANTHGDFSLAE